MKKIYFVLFITFFTSPAFAIKEMAQEVKTEHATYSCYGKKCTIVEGKEETEQTFEYTSITTSNSGKSVAKKKYKCTTNENGATCKAIFN